MNVGSMTVPFTVPVKLGTLGNAALAIKRALSKAGYIKWGGFTPVFGPFALVALKKFQKDHALKVDGVVGTDTLKGLAPFFDAYGYQLYTGYPQGLGGKVIAKARQYVGTKESPAGSNRQPFGAWYGLNGAPWCAIFITYVLVDLGFKNWVRDSFTASVGAISAAAATRTRGLAFTNTPQPGLALAVYGVDEHVEIFVKWVDQAKGLFQTIGGNTSAGDGSYNAGGEVAEKATRTVAGNAYQKPCRFVSIS